MPSTQRTNSDDAPVEITDAELVVFICPHCHKVVVGEWLDQEEPICIGPRSDPHDVVMGAFKLRSEFNKLYLALASIGTAASQGTREQTDWMITTAREAHGGFDR